MRNATGLILVFLAVISCTSEEVAPDNTRLGSDFYPLEVGQYSIFQVENIEYKLSGEVETKTFERKAEVVDSFINQTGALSYTMYYSQRQTSADPWTFDFAWAVRKNSNGVVLVEGNIPYLKLSFPIADGRSWDGNAFNTLDEDQFLMDSLYSTFITPALDTLENTLTVIQGDNQDFTVALDRRYEIYALNMGLVYQEDINLEYCTDANCLGQQIVEIGHEYRQYLIAQGKN